jgi:hypothetical protein
MSGKQEPAFLLDPKGYLGYLSLLPSQLFPRHPPGRTACNHAAPGYAPPTSVPGTVVGRAQGMDSQPPHTGDRGALRRGQRRSAPVSV